MGKTPDLNAAKRSKVIKVKQCRGWHLWKLSVTFARQRGKDEGRETGRRPNDAGKKVDQRGAGVRRQHPLFGGERKKT